MTIKYNSFLDVIFNRKSVRSYTSKVVSEGELEILLKAAMAAPSGRNEQPWAFIAVTDPSLLMKLAKELPYAKMLPKAGAGIVVCGYSVPHSRPGSKDLWEQDCAAATQNILLAAEAMNLGAVWTAVHPYPDRQEYIRKILNIPAHVYPFCVIPIGYPTGMEQPKDKFDPGKIHWGNVVIAIRFSQLAIRFIKQPFIFLKNVKTHHYLNMNNNLLIFVLIQSKLISITISVPRVNPDGESLRQNI